MRRTHNPRYAPEYLEQKLNPSGISGIPVAAEVYIPNSQQPDAATPAPAVVSTTVPATSGSGPVASPADEPGDPPVLDPAIPIGPAGPA
jgi:hypothetical protein